MSLRTLNSNPYADSYVRWNFPAESVVYVEAEIYVPQATLDDWLTLPEYDGPLIVEYSNGEWLQTHKPVSTMLWLHNDGTVAGEDITAIVADTWLTFTCMLAYTTGAGAPATVEGVAATTVATTASDATYVTFGQLYGTGDAVTNVVKFGALKIGTSLGASNILNYDPDTDGNPISFGFSMSGTVTLDPLPNDPFAGAIPVSTGVLDGQWCVGATLQAGEAVPPYSNSNAKTVWYTYTPAVTGSVAMGLRNANYDSALALYSGSAVNALTLIASNDDTSQQWAPGEYYDSYFDFVNVVGGQTYYVQVYGYSSNSGVFDLDVIAGSFLSPGPYDDIIDAVALSVSPLDQTVDMNTRNATQETNENTYGSGEPGVWAKIDLSALTGFREFFYDLTRIEGQVHPYFEIWAVNDASFNPAVPDFQKLTYQTGAGGANSASGSFNLNTAASVTGLFYLHFMDYYFAHTWGTIRFVYSMPPPPGPQSNETCATATLLGGVSGISAEADNRGVVGNWSSPDPLFIAVGNGGGAPLWWKWTNELSYEVYLRINHLVPTSAGAKMTQANIGIFRGACGSLTLAEVTGAAGEALYTYNPNHYVTASVAVGETVYIEVDGYSNDPADPPTLSPSDRGRFMVQWKLFTRDEFDTLGAVPWTVIGVADQTWGRVFVPEAGTVDADWYPYPTGPTEDTAARPSTDPTPFNVNRVGSIGQVIPRGPNGDVWSVMDLYPPHFGTSPGYLDVFSYAFTMKYPKQKVVTRRVAGVWTEVDPPPGQPWTLHQQYTPIVAGHQQAGETPATFEWPTDNYDMANFNSRILGATDGAYVYVYTHKLTGYFASAYEGIIYEDDITAQTGAINDIQVWRSNGGAWTQVGPDIPGIGYAPPNALAWAYNPFVIYGAAWAGYGRHTEIFSSPFDQGHPVVRATRLDQYRFGYGGPDPVAEFYQLYPGFVFRFDGTNWVELNVGITMKDAYVGYGATSGANPFFARWTRNGTLYTFAQQRELPLNSGINLSYEDIYIKNHTTGVVTVITNGYGPDGFSTLIPPYDPNYVRLVSVSNVSYNGDEFFLLGLANWVTYLTAVFKYDVATGSFTRVGAIATLEGQDPAAFLNDPDPESEKNHWYVGGLGMFNIDGHCHRGRVLLHNNPELGVTGYGLDTIEFADHTTRTNIVAGAGSYKIYTGSLCRSESIDGPCGECLEELLKSGRRQGGIRIGPGIF